MHSHSVQIELFVTKRFGSWSLVLISVASYSFLPSKQGTATTKTDNVLLRTENSVFTNIIMVKTEFSIV